MALKEILLSFSCSGAGVIPFDKCYTLPILHLLTWPQTILQMHLFNKRRLNPKRKKRKLLWLKKRINKRRTQTVL
jgi:hypothetical protein